MSDNVDFDGTVSYSKGLNKYDTDWWYRFQVHCALKAYKYPPFPSITRRIGNHVKRGTSFIKGKEMKKEKR